MDLSSLYKLAITHQVQHGCSAHPYEEFQKLFGLVKKNQPSRILEIGTGIGFSACVMALAVPDSTIDTIEKDPEHARLAKEFIQDCFSRQSGIAMTITQASLEMTTPPQITVHHDIAEILLADLNHVYDLIFFDGYQIHYEFLPHYERLLKSGGVLIVANTHLGSKTSAKFFEELSNINKWQVVESFNDTIVVKKVSDKV